MKTQFDYLAELGEAKEVIARLKKALLRLNYTPEQIEDICNGAI